MSSPNEPAPPPVPFTAEEYRARMARAAESAGAAGLAGVVVAPGQWISKFHALTVAADTYRD
ncbi:peptidase M24 family protein, partial [Streptomyces cavourensis]|nr:peptidase M24 family protein [Streptomyces cavourensis]